MKNSTYGLVIVLGLFASIVVAQEPGARLGVSMGYLDTDYTSGSAVAGVNVGYGFNDIIGLDAEYNYKFGDINGHLISAFIALTTTGKIYLKGKVGGTYGIGGAFSDGSGSLGIGAGGKVADGWVIELDWTQYSSDISGAQLYVKYTY